MADQWEVVEFPAILPSLTTHYGLSSGKKTHCCRLRRHCLCKNGMRSGNRRRRASESAIIKREWWQSWEKKEIPPVKYIHSVV